MGNAMKWWGFIGINEINALDCAKPLAWPT